MLLTVFLCISAYFFIGIIGMFVFRREHFIQCRLPILVTVMSLYRYFLALLYAYKVVQFYNPTKFKQRIPFSLMLWSQFLLVPLLSTSLFVHCADFSQSFLKQQHQLRTSNSNKMEAPHRITTKNRKGELKRDSWFFNASQCIIRKLVVILVSLQNVASRVLVAAGMDNFYSRCKRKATFGWIAMLFLLLVVLSLELVAVGIQYTLVKVVENRPFESVGCGGLESKSSKTQIGLRQEYTIKFIFFLVFYAIFLIWTRIIPSQSTIGRILHPDMWFLMASLITFTFSSYYPLFLYFTQRHHRSSDIMSYSRAQFEKVFDNPNLYKGLKDMAAKQLCLESILFIEEWREIGKLKESSFIMASLYDKYIIPGSPFELNISHQMFTDLTKKLHSGGLIRYDFDVVYQHVLDLAMTSVFFQFVQLCGDVKNSLN